MKKTTRRSFTAEQRQEYIGKIKALISNGATVKAACLEAGIRETQYRTWMNKKPKAVKRKYKRTPAPIQRMTLETSEREMPFIFIMGKSSDRAFFERFAGALGGLS